MLNRLIFVLLVGYFGSFHESPVNTAQNTPNDTIVWNAKYKLKYSDFKAEIPSESPYYALSHIGLHYEVKVVSNTEIEVLSNCIFLKNKSWFNKGRDIEKVNRDLLNHEQTHFNIGEYYVRIFRDSVSKLEVRRFNFNNKIRDLHAKIYKEYLKDAQLYDKETSHGVKLAAQKTWDKKINSGILKLAKCSASEKYYVQKKTIR